MNVLLEEPTVVIGVGDAVRTDAVRETLLEGVPTAFVAADSAADVLATLEERADIGCVVTGQSLSSTTGVELCREIRSRDENMPVVFYVGDADGIDPETPRRALNAGATGYYTAADPLADLRRAVDDAIETYDRRREAAEESELFTVLLEELDVNIYAKDEQARFLRLADLPENVDPADAIGKTDLEVFDRNPEMARETYEDDLEVIEAGEPIREKDERYGDGRTAYSVRTTKVPWTDEDGTTKGLLGVTVDITEFKRQEMELEILRDQFEKFSTNLQHDLKNPLQVAIGHLELYEDTGDERSLEHAVDALGRIEEMMTDLEAVAKDDSSDPGQGANSLADIADSIWNVLHTRDATLENEIPETTRTYTAKQTIRPLFENLFKNSVTHGGDDVTVRIGPLEDGFYIEDTGSGIPEPERESVFEPGYTTGESGIGMGLSIVDDISAQQGWNLEIEDSPEGGARFEITNCPMVVEPTADDRSDVVPDADSLLELTERTTVGTLEAGGHATYEPDQDRWTVSAGGHNIWRHWNDFYFVHRPVDGPVRIQGRVAGIENVDPFSKAGLMIRDDCDEDATYGYIGATPGFGTELLWRTRRGADGISQQLREDERSSWFRVDLLDGCTTCFVSEDGDDWTPVDQRPIDYTDPVQVGLVTCSVVPGTPCEATFEDVSVRRLESTGDG